MLWPVWVVVKRLTTALEETDTRGLSRDDVRYFFALEDLLMVTNQRFTFSK